MSNQFTVIKINGKYYIYTVTQVEGKMFVNIETVLVM